ARLGGGRGGAAGAVADEQQRQLGQGREHERPLPPRSQNLRRHGVDDLRQEVVVLDVEPRADLALAGDARADDLREPVYVVGTAAERTLERGPHAFRPRLGAEQAVTEPERARVPALHGEPLGDVEDERGRTAYAGG